MGDDDDGHIEIFDLDEAWSFLATYCTLKEIQYLKLTGDAQKTMTLIYALNIIDRHDIPAIHTQINNILPCMNSLPPLFKGCYNDEGERVRLLDILEYLRDHISTPGQDVEQESRRRTLSGPGGEGSTLARMRGLLAYG